MSFLLHVLPIRYGDGTMRVTVEQDVLFPNVPEANLEAMQKVRPLDPQLLHACVT